VSRDAFVDLPPDALSQLDQLETDVHLMCHITPGRPIKTWYHVGYECGNSGHKDRNTFNLLTSTIRGCETLQHVRVSCYSGDEHTSAELLPAFAHNTLQILHLRVALEAQDIAYDPETDGFRLTPSLVMQALPSGALGLFPKLEVL
jgi:hypothetical protein